MPPARNVRFDIIEHADRDRIKERVTKAVKKLKSLEVPVMGRVVPEDEDLVLGSGRQLNLAVLFLDISGSSNRPSGTHEAQNKFLPALNLFFSELVRIVEEYGGTVEKNTGDGLMAYFETSEQGLSWR